MEFLNQGPFKGKKLQFMGGVVGLSLCQTPTGIGFESISPIIPSLIEARPTSISMELERHQIGIGKYRYHSAQTLQAAEWLLAPVIPGDGCLLLACVFTECQFVQGLGCWCECGDELAVITHKPQETSDLCDGGWGRPFSNSIYFAFIGCYPLGRDSVPQICDLPVKQLAFGRLKFQPCLFQFLEYGLQSLEMAGQIFQKWLHHLNRWYIN